VTREARPEEERPAGDQRLEDLERFAADPCLDTEPARPARASTPALEPACHAAREHRKRNAVFAGMRVEENQLRTIVFPSRIVRAPATVHARCQQADASM
jgi:hypothetical protein